MADYRDGQSKIMTLKAVEFIRRFLQHVLPSGLVKIRHFGWLANRGRKQNLALCRRLLNARPTPIPTLPEPKADHRMAAAVSSSRTAGKAYASGDR